MITKELRNQTMYDSIEYGISSLQVCIIGLLVIVLQIFNTSLRMLYCYNGSGAYITINDYMLSYYLLLSN